MLWRNQDKRVINPRGMNISSMASIVKVTKSWHETKTFEIVAKRGRRFKTKNLKKMNLSAKKSISQKKLALKNFTRRKFSTRLWKIPLRLQLIFTEFLPSFSINDLRFWMAQSLAVGRTGLTRTWGPCKTCVTAAYHDDASFWRSLSFNA